MDSHESDVHSFIIKLWLEEATERTGRTTWRGQIRHVPCGEHSHIKSFEEIEQFISPYLMKGAEADQIGPRKWLKRWRRRW